MNMTDTVPAGMSNFAQVINSDECQEARVRERMREQARGMKTTWNSVKGI